MGLSLSVVLANAYMEHLEETIMSTTDKKPKVWKRYVDDVYVIWEHGHQALEDFGKTLNDLNPAIQFTREDEKEGQLAFLDVMIKRERGGKLRTTVFRKETTSNVFIKHDSNHPSSTYLEIRHPKMSGGTSKSSMQRQRGDPGRNGKSESHIRSQQIL